MRLDHLLSRERLTPKGVQGPVPPVGVVGCSMAETLVKFEPATVVWSWYAGSFGVPVETAGGAAGLGGEHPVGS